MRYLIFVLLIIVVASPVLAQVRSYSNPNNPTASSNTKPPEAWAGEVVGFDEGVMALKNGRFYSLDSGNVIEITRLFGVNRIDYVYDFENSILMVRGGNTDRIQVLPFSDISQKRLQRIKEYGCFVGQRVKSSNSEYFVEKHCQTLVPVPQGVTVP